MPKRILRTVADFLDVPPEELVACLRSFRQAIQQVQQLPAAARVLPEWTWNAGGQRGVGGPITPDSCISELGLNRHTVESLHFASIYRLADLSEMSRTELQVMREVGPISVAKLNAAMLKCGLAFRPHPDRARADHERAATARRIPIEHRAVTITDDSDLYDTGLGARTIERALGRGFKTVGELRGLTVKRLSTEFGTGQAREVCVLLERLGRPLTTTPSKVEQWRAGLVSIDDLRPP